MARQKIQIGKTIVSNQKAADSQDNSFKELSLSEENLSYF